MNHVELGKNGEDLAVNQLIKKKHKILERNYRFGKMELDVISKVDDIVVITEVKTRNSEVFGAPYLSVGKSKQRNIIKVANQYIQSKSIDNEVRFDVISIVLNSSKRVIEHIEGAFCPVA